jgi:hypothetical protein
VKVAMLLSQSLPGSLHGFVLLEQKRQHVNRDEHSPVGRIKKKIRISTAVTSVYKVEDILQGSRPVRVHFGMLGAPFSSLRSPLNADANKFTQ